MATPRVRVTRRTSPPYGQKADAQGRAWYEAHDDTHEFMPACQGDTADRYRNVGRIIDIGLYNQESEIDE